jgi:methionine-rich copper-binding protein CopC
MCESVWQIILPNGEDTEMKKRTGRRVRTVMALLIASIMLISSAPMATYAMQSDTMQNDAIIFVPANEALDLSELLSPGFVGYIVTQIDNDDENFDSIARRTPTEVVIAVHEVSEVTELSAQQVEAMFGVDLESYFTIEDYATPHSLPQPGVSGNNLFALQTFTLSHPYDPALWGLTFFVEQVSVRPHTPNSALHVSGIENISTRFNFEAGFRNIGHVLATSVLSRLGGPANAAVTVYELIRDFTTGINRTTRVETTGGQNFQYRWDLNVTARFYFTRYLNEPESARRLTARSSFASGFLTVIYPLNVIRPGMPLLTLPPTREVRDLSASHVDIGRTLLRSVWNYHAFAIGGTQIVNILDAQLHDLRLVTGCGRSIQMRIPRPSSWLFL